MNCVLNGTEFETEERVDASLFSEDNLSTVIIDGEKHVGMVLNSTYDFGNGSRFSLREMTTEEIVNKQLTDTQVGLAEVYEMIAELG